MTDKQNKNNKPFPGPSNTHEEEAVAAGVGWVCLAQGPLNFWDLVEWKLIRVS